MVFFIKGVVTMVLILVSYFTKGKLSGCSKDAVPAKGRPVSEN